MQAPKELLIKKEDLATILRQGKEQLPREACGLMIGRREGPLCRCDHLFPTRNVDESPYSFTIDPEELLLGYQHADAVGMEIVGIYHSHPARAHPSKTDLDYMKWSAPVWLIVSSLDWNYAAFRIEGDEPVGVDVTPA